MDEMKVETETSIRLATAIPGPRSQEWAKRREQSVARGVSSLSPVFVRKAEGAIIEDVDGNQLLDFSGGIGCLNTGHRPPAVVEALRKQAEEFLHTCFMVAPYEGYVRLAETLNRRAPGGSPKKTALFNSGAEAVENAIKIARSHTRRSGIIAFEDGFHGRTLMALSLTGKTHPYKMNFGPYAPEVYRLPFAYCYRCSYNMTFPECEVECAHRLQNLFERHVESDNVAAVIFEPVLGEGGFVTPPAAWFHVIAEICREHGVLIVADEVQTGFCRTGPVFACERWGMEPDLLVTAKSLAAGLPIGAVTGRADIMDTPGPGALGGTFGGNPLSCAAALAAWQTLDELDLPSRAEHLGEVFERLTSGWSDRFPLIGDIRGVGAMRAIEFVRDRATREPAAEETQRILLSCLRRGLLIIRAGTYGNVIRILVPLVATDGQFEEGLCVLEEALAEVHDNL